MLTPEFCFFLPQIKGWRCFQIDGGRKIAARSGMLRRLFPEDILSSLSAWRSNLQIEENFMKHHLQPAADSSAQNLNRHSRLFLVAMILVGLFGLSSLIAATPNTAHKAALLPQQAITGEWTAEVSRDKEDKIYLSLSRRTEKGDTNNNGSNVSLAELQGLSREQMLSPKTDVRFRIVREAGTFDFEGTFSGGRGAGLWTLTPSQNFIAAMRARGFDNLTEEQLVSSAMLDVRTKTVDDLKAAGFNDLTIHDVFKATIFKVNAEYISELKSLGYENLTLEELVKARIFKIDAAFAREVQAMGYQHQSLESLVKLRIFKITPEFLREMRTAGLDNLSLEDAVKLKIFKIDPDFIQRAKASGYTDLDTEKLVRLRIQNTVK
jgi:hypothetical protein